MKKYPSPSSGSDSVLRKYFKNAAALFVKNFPERFNYRLSKEQFYILLVLGVFTLILAAFIDIMIFSTRHIKHIETGLSFILLIWLFGLIYQKSFSLQMLKEMILYSGSNTDQDS